MVAFYWILLSRTEYNPKKQVPFPSQKTVFSKKPRFIHLHSNFLDVFYECCGQSASGTLDSIVSLTTLHLKTFIFVFCLSNNG